MRLDILAHEFAENLRRRLVLGATNVEETLSQRAIDSDTEAYVFVHRQSVTNGYTISKSVVATTWITLVSKSVSHMLGRRLRWAGHDTAR